MERKRCWESYESASRPAALIAFYFYTLLPPSYASQLVATGTPDSSTGTNTFSLVSMEKNALVHGATGGNDDSNKSIYTEHLGHFCSGFSVNENIQ